MAGVQEKNVETWARAYPGKGPTKRRKGAVVSSGKIYAMCETCAEARQTEILWLWPRSSRRV